MQFDFLLPEDQDILVFNIISNDPSLVTLTFDDVDPISLDSGFLFASNSTTQSCDTISLADVNYSLVIAPNGSGALIAAIPDGTTVGGDARGEYAVDLQRASRNSSSQVASGNFSVITGGLLNTASGTVSVVGGGATNTASNLYAVVLGGEGNTASGNYSAVGGGSFNTASGSNAVVSGGSTNTASGDNSFAAGTHAQAIHQGAFVLSDSQTTNFSSAAINHFNARFQNGYRFVGGTNAGLVCVADVDNEGTGQLVCSGASDTRKQFFMEYNTTRNCTEIQSVQFGVTATNLYINPYTNGASGYVGVNQLSANYPLDVNGSAHASSFPTSSDVRLKKNINYLHEGDTVLEKIMQLKPCTFNWNERHPAYENYVKDGQEELQVGFVAQEVEHLFPYLVTKWSFDHQQEAFRKHMMRKNVDPLYAEKTLNFKEDDTPGDYISDYRALDYSRMVALLCRALQETVYELREYQAKTDKRLELLEKNK